MARSTFSPIGLPIGENNINMTYLYGLSDFFSVMFEDPNKLNLMLEATSEKASEIYSTFLQLTSSISLADIQKTSGETLKLVTIKSSNAVLGELNVFLLPEDILSARYIANRPLLPTTLLEQNVDYQLELNAKGQSQIRFAKDISSTGFSTRVMLDEDTKEYALWFVDAEIDEKWIYKYYGKLLGVNSETSTEVFKNYIYGLYYVYSNGPTLDLIRKGLNLILGVPLSRGEETVLEIRKYLETDQYIVITDSNQYLLPYGLLPAVVEGQLVHTSEEISKWVEVKDYINDGDWWIDLQIPASIIPHLPGGQKDRYAVRGSHYDYLMSNYLKKHTFLVKINVTFFKSNQLFTQLSNIIRKLKPSYAQAVYIWSLNNSDNVNLIEEPLIQTRVISKYENLSTPTESFYRGNSEAPTTRGQSQFLRCSIPDSVKSLIGTSSYHNGFPTAIEGGVSTGQINGISQYRTNTDAEKAWNMTIMSRSSELSIGTRSKVGYFRNTHSEYSNLNYPGVPCSNTRSLAKISSAMKVIPLYTTTKADIILKCSQLGVPTPNISDWAFDILNPSLSSTSIKSHFSSLFSRSSNVLYMSNSLPIASFESWSPTESQVLIGDYLVCIRVIDDVLGVYWVTSNTSDLNTIGFPIENIDPLEVKITTTPHRGMGISGSPFYLNRGVGTLNYNNAPTSTDGVEINEDSYLLSTLIGNYSDTENPITVSISRSSSSINHLVRLT